ncbi:MAG: non-homologous end-joining DNA ligase, partial [Actinomycetota bacterium]|nr:non-homologous end-joining DNA ligase [Actinomycetota bacterium]
VLVDWSQNNAAKTTIVPYSLRGRPSPTVAAPRTWRELSSASLRHLHYEEVMRRVHGGKDPFAAVDEASSRAARSTAGGGHGGGDAVGHGTGGKSDDGDARRGGGHDDPRLNKYRSLRDQNETPEPFTAEKHHRTRSARGKGLQQDKAGRDGKEVFVIQEHHASRLHYDLRLEHEGVLVSWALPKGVPETGSKNHLAVQTEDHPMDYADFEGTIPKGQYGAGTMTIWDKGVYDLEKWVNGKEVIVTLTGREGGGLGGTKKFALIHTGEGQGDQGQWLIHLMDKPHGVRGKRGTLTAAARIGTGTGASGQAKSGTAKPGAGTAEPGAGAAEPGAGAAEPGNDEAGKAVTATSPAGKTGTGRSTAASTSSTIIEDPTPMLATAGTPADLHGSDWSFELKWDGIRALVVADSGKVRLLSRNGNDMSASYPELTDRSCWPSQDFIADGEIVALGPRGTPDFGLLQGRMKLTKPGDVKRARMNIPVQLMLFDLLSEDGEDLRRRTLEERRARLQGFYRPSDCPVLLSETLDERLELILESARELGLEGVMAKRTDSRYVSGQRSRLWIKLKIEQTQEVVVGGWRPGKGERSDTVGALLLGIPDGGKLRYVGRVGTGFSTRELTELRQRMNGLSRKTSPFDQVPALDAAGARWVNPDLVGEVAFGEWTGSGKLRHPVWRGWRLDKKPEDVVTETVRP